MGNCQSEIDSPPCQQNASEPLKADADIVGIGVIAAFLITAIAAFSAVAFAYLTDSVDDRLLNDVDLLIIGRYQRSNASRLVLKMRDGWHEVKNFVRRCLNLKYPAGGYIPLSRDNRIEAFGRFILSLSDQILATGLATLVAGVSNECRLSLFEFNIVVSLGWFSITTHLATLSLLREYFLHNKVVRNWRFLGMMASTALLIYGLIITSELFVSGQDERTCLALAFTYATGISFSYSLLSTVITVLYLVAAFNGAVLSSSQLNQEPGGYFSWFPIGLVFLFMQIFRRKVGSSYKDRFAIAREAANQHFEESEKELVAKRNMLPDLSLPRRWLVVLLIYSDSFLSSMASRFFDLSYGISQLVEARWVGPPDLDESDNRMDFGQIVPLTLLAIPMLVAAELYYEYHKKNKSVKSFTASFGSSSENFKNSSNPSSASSSRPESHSTGLYRLPDPVHLPQSDPRRMQADTFYGVQGLNISENPLSSTSITDKCDRGTQTDPEDEESRPDPKNNPYKGYFSGLMIIFVIHAVAAIAAGVTLNLTSWGALFGSVLGILTSMSTLLDFYDSVRGIAKHVEAATTKWQNLHSSQSTNDGTGFPAEHFQPPVTGSEPLSAEMMEFTERPQRQQQDLYTMHGALPLAVDEHGPSNVLSDARSSAQIASENEGHVEIEGHEPYSDMELSSRVAASSSQANAHVDSNSQDHHRGTSLPDVEQGNSGRESPDLYGATPPQVCSPEPIIGRANVAYVDLVPAVATATSGRIDGENDNGLYRPKHQDTEADIAIPELMPDTAMTTSAQTPSSGAKRTWTK